MNEDIASVAGPSERRTSGNLIARIAFPAAAVAMLLPFVSPGAALLLGMLLALTVGNPYAIESSRLVSPLLQVSVIGLGAGMNLAEVGRVGAHGFFYTVIGITLTMTVGLILGRLIRTERDTSLLVTRRHGDLRRKRDRGGRSDDPGAEPRGVGGAGDGVFSQRRRAVYFSLDWPSLRA